MISRAKLLATVLILPKVQAIKVLTLGSRSAGISGNPANSDGSSNFFSSSSLGEED